MILGRSWANVQMGVRLGLHHADGVWTAWHVSQLAGKVAMTTTISAASGCITATFLSRIVEKTYNITMGLNGILAGLVSVTAGCAVVNP